MAEYLFLFTIGPVQEFIAAARRTRDLWAGSQLLSELSRAAAQVLQDKPYEATLIFPIKETLSDQTRNISNRILAQLSTENKLEDIGKAIEAAVFEQLKSICQRTLVDSKNIVWPRDESKNYRDIAELQIADLVEMYWAVVERTNNYKTDREKVEAALAARKNTRDFIQPNWASAAPKSSIDGLRESVIDEREYPDRTDSAEERQRKTQQLFDHYGAKGAERLSGVDLLKRHYRSLHRHADFPSTSHFAALPMLNRFEKPFRVEAAKRWEEYLESLKQQGIDLNKLDRQHTRHPIIGDYDASLLFEERLSDIIEDVKKRENAKRALRMFLSAFTDGKAPEPYYALLHGDGDFMGKTIAALAKGGIEKHREFSQALDTFAGNVCTIVEKLNQVEGEGQPIRYDGSLVYSGGDDVLALLPLHTVVQCAKELAVEFDKHVGRFEYFDEDLELMIKPSLSIGIAICHHLEPLSDALNLVRAAEKIAKKGQKNALAITLSKRGTGDRTISGSWAELPHPNNKGFYDRLQKLTLWHRTGAIPDSAAYDLHDLIERMGDALEPAALRAEAVRIVKRKRGQQGKAIEANDKLVALAETLPEKPEDAKNWNLQDFANELIVTREFAKAQGFIEADKQQGFAA